MLGATPAMPDLPTTSSVLIFQKDMSSDQTSSSPASSTTAKVLVPPERTVIFPKDKAAALAHFEPATARQMNWANGDTSTWPTFSALHCKPTSQSATTASVSCTFSESEAPAAGNPDSFWGVDLQRQSDGRWLISDYGQG